MFLFRHTLQLCSIICISVATEGHVLFAVNIEDFKNLANQFLSTNVARRLTRLVSENRGAIRRDDTSGDIVSGIDLNTIAEIIKGGILTQHKTTASSTKKTRTININKRFNTVKNTVDTTEFPKTTKRTENIRIDPNYETSPGLVYVKDDLESLFQNYNEPSNDDDTTKHDYYETRPNKSEEIVSEESPSTKGSMDIKENTKQQDDTNKKMDNTEAKLGEWLYNHIIAEKPTKLQNHKTGNRDINDEEYSDELPDKSKQVQYVYSPLDQDKKKQNIGNVADLQFEKDTNNFNHQDQQTGGKNNDYVMGPKRNTIYKNTPQKQPIEQNREMDNVVMDDYVKPIPGIRNTLKQKSNGIGPDQLLYEQESIMTPQFNTKDKMTPQKQIIEEHQEIDNEVMDKRDSIKSIPGNKNTFNRESFGLGQDQQAYEQGAINESIMRPQLNTNYKKKPEKQEIEENYMSSKTIDQEIENFYSQLNPEYVQVKKLAENKNTFNNKHTDLDESVARMPADVQESNPEPLKSKIASFLFAEEGKQQPIEKHILYDKYVLGSKDKENNQKAPQRQSVRDNDELSKETKRVDPKQVDTSDETLMMEIQNVFKQNEEEAAAHSSPDIKQTKKQVPLRLKEAKSDSDKSKKESTLHDTLEEKIQKDSKQENNILRKRPQKHSIEENDMHETYALSSEARNKKHTNVKPKLKGDYKSKQESKHEYGDVSDKDEEISNKKNTLKNTKGNSNAVAKQRLRKKAPMDKKKYNEDLMQGFESAKLGSSSDEIKEKQVKEHDTTNNYKLEKRKETPKQQAREEDEKYDNKRHQKHSIEENDMHETIASSSETKNKKGNRYDNKSNKSQHKETFKKQVNEVDDKYDTKYKKRHQKDSIEENDKQATFKKQTNEVDDNYEKTKKRPQKHSIEENDKRETFKKQANEVDEKYDTKYKKRPQKHSIEENDMHEKSSSETKNKKGNQHDKNYNKYQHKETSKKQSMEENKTYEKETPDSKRKDKTKFKKQPIEENSMYEIYELGSKHKSKDREIDKDDDNGHEETVVGKKNHGRDKDDFNHGRNKDDFNHGRNEDDLNHGSNKDDSDNNDELLLKNKNRHILKATKKVNRPKHEDDQEERPLEGYADDPRPDFKEVKPENIKANTYRILESDERKGKPTKRFVMKGTLIPKREFYKLSSPDYYKNLPRNVEKYDFSEPIPDRDRQRDKVRYLKREPARVNRKVKLPRFERVK